MSKPKPKIPATPEAFTEFVDGILQAIHTKKGHWFKAGTAQDALDRARSDGVCDAEDAVVAYLQELGFDMHPLEDDARRPASDAVKRGRKRKGT